MTIYLYVKQHSKTKLKYFGKTTEADPFKYKGSGTYWINHIKKHGRKQVTTLAVWGFDDQEMCTEFALKFSKEHNIIESTDWANKIPENGIDGGKLHEGFASVKDSEGNCKLIPVQDLHNSDYVGVAKGTVSVKDKNGKNYRVSLTDPRYLSGELVNNRAKMCYVIDSNGTEHWIKFRDYDKKMQTYLRDCPFNDYEGYAKTAKGGEKRRGKSYHTLESIERLRELGKRNAKPKEIRHYVCIKCGITKEKLEYSHHTIKESYRCGNCRPGRPRKHL